MSTKCSQCSYAKLNITGELLNIGEYQCSKGCDMGSRTCDEFKLDSINEDFEYSYAS